MIFLSFIAEGIIAYKKRLKGHVDRVREDR
jgi:hypothetical protein